METAAPVVLKNDEMTFEQLRALLYEERAFHNVIISPGPGSPTHPEDIGMNHFCFLLSIRVSLFPRDPSFVWRGVMIFISFF